MLCQKDFFALNDQRIHLGNLCDSETMQYRSLCESEHYAELLRESQRLDQLLLAYDRQDNP